jgi:hypothetical protein
MIKVSELIAMLQSENPDAVVGTALSNISGWVNGIEGIRYSKLDDGTPVVVIDMAETTLTSDEQEITDEP